MRYLSLVKIYELIESTSKRLEMTEYLVNLLKKTPFDIIDKVIYLTQGKLYPDFKGIEIGIAEKLVIKAIAVVGNKTEDQVEEIFQEKGDLGKAAEQILQKKAQQTLYQRPLSVNIVYNSLVKMALASGVKAVETKIRHLSSLFNDASPKEVRYIVRTVLGKLRLGIADMTLLDALSITFAKGKEDRPLIERAYNLSSDLGLVAKTIAKNGVKGAKEFKIRVGNPIRPMLAERLSNPDEIIKKLDGHCAAEYKYDGLRVQAHIAKDKIDLFSRRLENITHQFPDIIKSLKEGIDCVDCILEGECVAYDPNTGKTLPFQVVSQRRGRKYGIELKEKEIPVTIYLFDLLYKNKKDYTLVPYIDRRLALESILKKNEKISLSHQMITEKSKELEDFMDQAISEGWEGLVVKSVSSNSFYQAGARGWLWIKYKRSQKAGILDTFDLVAIGAFRGRGRRTGTYGALLMATYNKDQDSFETICKLGSGFTDEDLKIIQKKVDGNIDTMKNARFNSLIKPDVWLIPSIVLEVTADEITLSPLHSCGRDIFKKETGLALRFPRFTGKYRLDKSTEDATTTKEVINLYTQQSSR